MRARLALSAFVFVIASIPLMATVTVPVGFQEIVTRAALIVRGRVTDVKAVVLADRRIDSFATILVEDTLKGEALTFVSVRVPGGEIGGFRFVMVGAPRLRVNERAVFFLARDSEGAWRPVGLSAGIFAVEEGSPNGRAVVRPPLIVGRTASVGRVVRGDVRRRPIAVEEFESLVRMIVVGRVAGARPR